jgi:hypothetical protein
MLTQVEAEALFEMPKQFTGSDPILLVPGIDETRELTAVEDAKEKFLFDLWRGTIRLSRVRYQERARTVVVLARLDLDGAHTNPDGEKLTGPHLHRYREGFDDKWATPIDPTVFTNLTDAGAVLKQFCGFCKIGNVPPIQDGLA